MDSRNLFNDACKRILDECPEGMHIEIKITGKTHYASLSINSKDEMRWDSYALLWPMMTTHGDVEAGKTAEEVAANMFERAHAPENPNIVAFREANRTMPPSP